MIRPGRTIIMTDVVTYPSGKVVTTETLSPSIEVETKTKVIVSEPPFRPGKFLIKPYSVSSTTMLGTESTVNVMYKRPDGVVLDRSIQGPLAATQQVYNSIPFLYPEPTGARMDCLNKAYGAVDSSVWEAGVDLGELRETLELLRDPFKALRELATPQFWRNLLSLKRMMNGASVRMSADVAAQTRLTWQYGIRPLVGSIQDIFTMCTQDLEKASREKLFSKRSRKKFSDDKKMSVVRSTERWTTQSTYTGFTHAKVFYRRVEDQSLKRALGLTPSKLPSLAWELTRLSFVWDWFLSVGNWLNAIEPKPSVQFLGAISGYRLHSEHRIALERVSLQGNIWKPANAVQTASMESYERWIHNSPTVTPVWRGIDGLSVSRTVDALSLIWSMISPNTPLRY